MTSKDGIQTVVIIVAMEQEAKPFIEQHGLTLNTEDDTSHHAFLPGVPFRAYSGFVSGGLRCHLVWTGKDKRYSCNNVATTASAVACYAAVARFRPDLVISAGTAGGFAGLGAQIGDVYLSTKCIYHSRRIPDESGMGLEEYGYGHFRSPFLPELALAAGLKRRVVSTSDSLNASKDDLEIMSTEGVSVKEMEAASVAWTCQNMLGGVPFVAVKSITDIVDGATATEVQFYANLAQASDELQKRLTKMLKLLHLGMASHSSTGVADELKDRQQLQQVARRQLQQVARQQFRQVAQRRSLVKVIYVRGWPRAVVLVVSVAPVYCRDKLTVSEVRPPAILSTTPADYQRHFRQLDIVTLQVCVVLLAASSPASAGSEPLLLLWRAFLEDEQPQAADTGAPTQRSVLELWRQQFWHPGAAGGSNVSRLRVTLFWETLSEVLSNLLPIEVAMCRRVWEKRHAERCPVILQRCFIQVDLVSPAVDVDAPLDDRDIDLVQQTFARVAMLGANNVGKVVFMNIFKIAPEAQGLFPFRHDVNMYAPGGRLEVHATKVVTTLAVAIELLRDLGTLVPVLKELGLKHVGFGVLPEHYDVVGQA
ncbi:unnamed protein product, partial [Polarella glacialis]